MFLLQELKLGKLSDLYTSQDDNKRILGRSGWSTSDPESSVDEEVALVPSTVPQLGRSQL